MRREKLKLVWIALTVVIFVDSLGVTLRPPFNEQQLTDADLVAVRQLAFEFTTGFVRSTDLEPVIQEHFAKDFIQRRMKGMWDFEVGRKTPHLYLVPGLEYNSHLLSEAKPADWL